MLFPQLEGRVAQAYIAFLVVLWLWVAFMFIQSLTYDFESDWRVQSAEDKAIELCVDAVSEGWDRLTLEQQLSEKGQKALKRAMKRCT